MRRAAPSPLLKIPYLKVGMASAMRVEIEKTIDDILLFPYTSGKKDLGPDQFVLRRPSTVHVLNELSGNIGCQPPTA